MKKNTEVEEKAHKTMDEPKKEKEFYENTTSFCHSLREMR
jgi:hypothetical protein